MNQTPRLRELLGWLRAHRNSMLERDDGRWADALARVLREQENIMLFDPRVFMCPYCQRPLTDDPVSSTAGRYEFAHVACHAKREREEVMPSVPERSNDGLGQTVNSAARPDTRSGDFSGGGGRVVGSTPTGHGTAGDREPAAAESVPVRYGDMLQRLCEQCDARLDPFIRSPALPVPATPSAELDDAAIDALLYMANATDSEAPVEALIAAVERLQSDRARLAAEVDQLKDRVYWAEFKEQWIRSNELPMAEREREEARAEVERLRAALAASPMSRIAAVRGARSIESIHYDLRIDKAVATDAGLVVVVELPEDSENAALRQQVEEQDKLIVELQPRTGKYLEALCLRVAEAASGMRLSEAELRALIARVLEQK